MSVKSLQGWRAIPGWFNFAGWYDEVLETAPRGTTLVEIGSAFGRSAAYLARRAIDMKRHDLRLVAVDPFEWQVALGDPTCDTYRRALGGQHLPFNVMLRGMTLHCPEELERLTLLRLPSVEAARIFDRVHLAMIDADHAYEPCRDDIRAWRARATILAGHDHDLPGVRKACTEVLGPEDSAYHVRPAEPPDEGDFLAPGSGMGAVWVRGVRGPRP
jgi:Methyltransferase domain